MPSKKKKVFGRNRTKWIHVYKGACWESASSLAELSNSSLAPAKLKEHFLKLPGDVRKNIVHLNLYLKGNIKSHIDLH